MSLAVGVAIAGAGGTAAAQTEVFVTQNIATSTTWTANNRYNLLQQIYVLPGATLTIEAGTVVASATNVGGSLAVTRGAQIFVQGTETAPVIMTSKADTATWIGANPANGTWREAANEWGNLTIMGRGYISACPNCNGDSGNVPTPSATNVAQMEGLVAAFPGDQNVLYGGGNDDDDSGSISYLSIRYCGKVIALNNELNGLSLGGIGRATDIHHVEIMNNVDDGIEIWGGTVNLKYFSVWNVGDDSLDIDQGWRGKAQFGLIVQGWSVDANQGSGVGDNCIETDGAERSDYQPVTTASIYNVTVIGQPDPDGSGPLTAGDQGTAWRDNARVQYRNCVFMDVGRSVVAFDNVDGDACGCGTGYGFNGTLTWAQTWTTDWNVYSAVNQPNLPLTPSQLYQAQTSGKLAEIKDSVFFNNGSYTEAVARGVFAAANNNVLEPGVMPIRSITRGPIVTKGGESLQQVVALDPRPAADALTSAAFAPEDGFFTSARFRGGFAPGTNWAMGWTAASDFGFLVGDERWTDVGQGCAGTNGAPVCSATGALTAGSPVTLAIGNALPGTAASLVVSGARDDAPLFGCTLVPSLIGAAVVGPFPTGTGDVTLPSFPLPAGIVPGSPLYLQWIVADPGAANGGLAFSNGLLGVTQ